MLKSVSLFNRKKTSRPFKDFYAEWIDTLKTTHLHLLRHSLSSSFAASLATHVDTIHHHFNSYYAALDLAASNDVGQLLFPSWRNPLEIPFLWIGDFHPYLFTNLLRSFLNEEEFDEIEEIGETRFELGENPGFFDRPWNVVTAWKSPSNGLMSKIEQIECGLRLMVPEIMARSRHAHKVFVERIGADWGKFEGRREAATRAAVGEAMEAEMDEMTGIFIDANRLRRSVLADIVSATSVYQGALFLEGLAQFFVGFRDRELIGEFERCKVAIN
ncbi:Protein INAPERTURATE like [Actinidia chinensis var. chinensis]|uniref:Protein INAPERTURATE like n=1 Tax=Actinidia chinensis var. chinensis TaxID=1590841 RepID=A0A2R6PI72_ACTCC|nr:Protein INAPERTURATE like [Actinidia chinensis var. chinensis]